MQDQIDDSVADAALVVRAQMRTVPERCCSTDGAARVVSFGDLAPRLGPAGGLIALLLTKSEHVFAHVIPGVAVSADENIFALTCGFGTAHVLRVAPYQLRIMADIFHVAGGAVFGKRPSLEELPFTDPRVDARFQRIVTSRSRPKVFALGVGG